MGIKSFDLPPDGLKDGAIATSSELENIELTEDQDYHNPENPGGMHIIMRPQVALYMMKVEIPTDVINEINTHIDETIIPNNKDFSDQLVGQINRDTKSAQLKFPHKDDEVGEMVAGLLQKLGQTYIKNVVEKEGILSSKNTVVTTESMWTVHSYEGDYNPLHDHGTATPIGLSCILYLKVPDQIKALPNPAEEFYGLNSSSGSTDGFTYFVWGNHGMRDINMLRPATEEYVKPEEGVLLMFPSWLRHSVNPFFGEGERRTFSANMNVILDGKVPYVTTENN